MKPFANTLRRACFLDRDGVVNVEVDYLSDPDKTILETNIVPALRLAQEHHMPVVVVTNQSGIARGLYSENDMHRVHERIQQLLVPYGVSIDRFYFCPHHPSITGPCACRKPQPGMLLQAAQDLRLDCSRSVMIGDRLSDIEAGRAAGCQASYLVRTGYGPHVLEKGENLDGISIADDAWAALKDFLVKNPD